MKKVTQDDIVEAIKKKFGFEHIPGKPQSITLIGLLELIPDTNMQDIGEVLAVEEDAKRVDGALGPAAIEIPGKYFDEDSQLNQSHQ